MKTLLTADVCVNHRGDLTNLLQLLNIVYKCQIIGGCKILFKMQKRNPDLYSDRRYKSWVLNKTVPYKKHKSALEFNLEQYKRLDQECKMREVEWYCSAFDHNSLNFLVNNFSYLKYWKVASPVTAEQPELVKAICEQPGIKFISTGMCTKKELDISVNEALKVTNNNDLILMHCTSMYPTPNTHVNLNRINALKKEYGLKVGYSAHDTGVPISVAAVALGAVAIERHITLDRSGSSPDDALSLEFNGLETLVRHINAIEEAMGSPVKQFYEEEKAIREKVRIKT